MDPTDIVKVLRFGGTSCLRSHQGRNGPPSDPIANASDIWIDIHCSATLATTALDFVPDPPIFLQTMPKTGGRLLLLLGGSKNAMPLGFHSCNCWFGETTQTTPSTPCKNAGQGCCGNSSLSLLLDSLSNPALVRSRNASPTMARAHHWGARPWMAIGLVTGTLWGHSLR
jgi:hypothetical protein